MDRTYWEKVAADYDGEIFDSFARARGKILTKRLDEFADTSVSAADAGCGVGKYLPALSERFRSVDAYDLSSGLLRQAKQAAAGCGNVRFFQRDFSKRATRVAPVRFALCANVLIMPSREVREAVLRTVRRMVEPGGHALFLVPSLESALLVHHRLIEWNRRDGLDAEAAVRASTAPAARASAQAIRQGLVPLAGVPTKHYLKEEALLLLREHAFEAFRFDKVEYGWETEFAGPPDWMRSPHPWDWLISARRVERI